MAFVLKFEVGDARAETLASTAVNLMYGGKAVKPGDTVFVFASETQGGRGLVARGVAQTVRAVPPAAGVARHAPRVDLAIAHLVAAKRSLGREELRLFRDWDDGRPGTELNFKLYRQATNKLVGVSDAAAAYLDGFF